MSSQIKCYAVSDRSMEDDCPICGFPVMVGDQAFETLIDSGFCSRTCARRHLSSIETEARLTVLETSGGFA